MNIQKIISKKSIGIELSYDEISFLINGIHKYVKDYQMSSFLMSVKIMGFTDNELFYYTKALIDSGNVLPENNFTVDKHSSGGIGDKTSLILLPMLNSVNIKMFKISGRGLGYTGGTLDKLNVFKNINFTYPLNEINHIFKNINVVICSASNDVVPADSYTYKLRDTSGTVESLPLIAASIMSKKIAVGSKMIFIDLKVGKGAFLKTIDEAKKLGKSIKKIAKKFNRHVFILYSDMNQLLGNTCGNAIEIKESLDFLRDYSLADKNLFILVQKIFTEIYSKYFNVSLKESKQKFIELLESDSPYNSFIDIIKHQQADIDLIKDDKYFKPNFETIIYAKKDGYFNFNNLEDLGFLLIELGAGRKSKEDKLYYHSGFKINFKNNDEIKLNDKIALIYSEKEITDEFIERFNKIYSILKSKSKNIDIILFEEP